VNIRDPLDESGLPARSAAATSYSFISVMSADRASATSRWASMAVALRAIAARCTGAAKPSYRVAEVLVRSAESPPRRCSATVIVRLSDRFHARAYDLEGHRVRGRLALGTETESMT
jgi:hypothetical protein